MSATESDIETLRIHTEASSSERKIAVLRKQASAAASDVLGPLEYTRSDISLLIQQCRHDKDLMNAAVTEPMGCCAKKRLGQMRTLEELKKRRKP